MVGFFCAIIFSHRSISHIFSQIKDIANDNRQNDQRYDSGASTSPFGPAVTEKLKYQPAIKPVGLTGTVVRERTEDGLTIKEHEQVCEELSCGFFSGEDGVTDKGLENRR